MYPAAAPGKGGRWALSQAQIDSVLAYFQGKRNPIGDTAPAARTTPSPISHLACPPADWLWEGHVQDALVAGP